MQLYCPMCCGWTVIFAEAEIWTGPDGKPSEFVDGKCERCRSRVLVKPSQRAIETAKARLGGRGCGYPEGGGRRLTSSMAALARL
jgi:hypothetical protein